MMQAAAGAAITLCLLLAAPVISLAADARADKDADTPRPTMTWQPGATVPGVVAPVRVGTCEVFENRETRQGRKIELRVVVLQAETPSSPAASDALFILVGGPGQAASAGADFYARVFAGVRQTRDIVLLDQRGTGGSNGLGGDLYGETLAGVFSALFPPAAVATHRAEWERRADLRCYTTALAVADLDDVRAALGYEWINLFGTSYGTRVAQEYLRRHPARVRTVILKGVVPMDMPFPRDFGPDSQRSLDRVLARCATDERVGAVFYGIRADFDAVRARLQAGPVQVALTDPKTGQKETVSLSRGTFAVTLRTLLQSISTAAEIPLLIHQAARGDFEPFAQKVLAVRRAASRLVFAGMLFSVGSAEDLPRIDPESMRRTAEETLLGDYYYQQLLAVCADWPRGATPEDFAEPVVSEVPALLISGFYDPATPPEGAEAVARHLPNSRHLLIANGSHSYSGLSPMMDQVMADFIRRGSVEGLDVSGLERVAFPAFKMPAANAKEPMASTPSPPSAMP